MLDQPGPPRRLGDRPAVGVVGAARFAFGHPGFHEAGAGFRRQHGVGEQGTVPAEHVAEGGVQAAVAAQRPEGSALGFYALAQRAPVLTIAVAVGDALHRPSGGLVAGLQHPRRLQHLLAQEGLVSLPRDQLDHRGQQAVAGVRVFVALAGWEAKPGSQGSPHVLLATHRIVVSGAEVGVQAGAVGEQVMKGDGGLIFRHARQEATDGMAHPQLAEPFEPEDGGGGELLGDGPQVEHAVHAHGQAAFAIGRAVALHEHHVRAPSHQQAAREADRLQPGHELVELGPQLALNHRDRRVRGHCQGCRQTSHPESQVFRERHGFPSCLLWTHAGRWRPDRPSSPALLLRRDASLRTLGSLTPSLHGRSEP